MLFTNIIFASAVIALKAMAREQTRVSTSTSSMPQISTIGIIPAQTIYPSVDAESYPDPDLMEDVDDNENGPPDVDDETWVAAFMAGEPIDQHLDFDMHDLIVEDDDPRKPNNHSQPEDNDFVSNLTRARVESAVARAHHRARLRNQGKLNAGSPEQEDQTWAQSFVNGEEVDEDLIFDPADLKVPVDDSSNDIVLVSLADFNDWRLEAAILATAHNGDALDDTRNGTALAKRHRRYKHPPRNSVQIFRRWLRAHKGARHRARVRRRRRAIARQERHRIKVQRRKRQEYIRKHNNPGYLGHYMNHKLKHSAHQFYPDADHRADGTLRHGVKRCGRHVPVGYNCDGSPNCAWFCKRGINICNGSIVPCSAYT